MESDATVKTEPVFLTNTYLFELEGCELLEATPGGDPPKGAPEAHVKITVVLSRSIFHPQGGGQPADQGHLRAEGLPELPVLFTSLRKEDGAILHDCAAEPSTVEVWASAASSATPVSCHIDEQRRTTAARIHSAGHLLDAAVTAVGLGWQPGKGYHFPDGPYVEYLLPDGCRKIDAKKPGDKEAVMRDIQDNIDRLVEQGGAVSAELKAGVRHVAMAGEECPCGGTHVVDVAEIGKVSLKKLQNKQGNIRLSYTVAA
jgi:Ser-tRNA(Ala) deacylase AlaX